MGAARPGFMLPMGSMAETLPEGLGTDTDLRRDITTSLAWVTWRVLSPTLKRTGTVSCTISGRH